jgi:hypothetical protein
MPAMPVLPGRAGLLQDHLLVRAAAADAPEFVAAAARPGSGMLLAGRNAVETAVRLRRGHPELPILIDRRRYASRHPVPGVAPFDPDWTAVQRRLRTACVLTDSGFIDRSDTRSLRTVLGRARAAGQDVTAVLPLHTDWLRRDLDQLCQTVVDHGVPVAVVVEGPGDPLGVLRNLYGLTAVLALPVPVAVLGTGLSALGALAYGATWTAVGVRTHRRHLRPVTGAGPHRPVRALVDPALSMVSVQRIAASWAATQAERDWWSCECRICGGRTMDWMLTASALEADAHTVARLLDRRDALAALPVGSLRRQAWRAQCSAAGLHCQLLALAGVGWEPPRQLSSWQQL